MVKKVVDSNYARKNWRDILDMVFTGKNDIIVKRYGKPVVVIIPYDDFIVLQDELDDIRAGRYVATVYEEWKLENKT